MGTVDAGRLAYIGDASAVAGVPSHGVDSIPSREDHVSYLVPVRFRRGVVGEAQPPAIWSPFRTRAPCQSCSRLYAGNSSCRAKPSSLRSSVRCPVWHAWRSRPWLLTRRRPCRCQSHRSGTRIQHDGWWVMDAARLPDRQPGLAALGGRHGTPVLVGNGMVTRGGGPATG